MVSEYAELLLSKLHFYEVISLLENFQYNKTRLKLISFSTEK